MFLGTWLLGLPNVLIPLIEEYVFAQKDFRDFAEELVTGSVVLSLQIEWGECDVFDKGEKSRIAAVLYGLNFWHFEFDWEIFWPPHDLRLLNRTLGDAAVWIRNSE